MPVRDTEAALVKLRLLLLMLTAMLLVHHGDARPFMNCRLASFTGDERQLSLRLADCSATQQPPAETIMGDAATLHSTVHQVTYSTNVPKEYNFVKICA